MAIAIGPARTTLWTSLRLDGTSGPVGFVLPVDPGAALDVSSDAWFEALDLATAPRVLPPPSASSTCPGEAGDPHAVHVTCDTDHVASLALDDVAVLPDAAAVSAWADANGLPVPPSIAATLASLTGKRFLAARFQAKKGVWVTPTLRVVTPGGAPLLPLALTQAPSSGPPLLVTVWTLGEGRGGIVGAPEIPPLEVAWDAAQVTSTYAATRLDVLAAAPTAVLTEASSHKALAQDVAILSGTATIDGVVGTYFERGAAYAGSPTDVQACVVAAAAALASSAPVSPSCAPADLGVVDGASECVESPVSGQTDPALLRCGDALDDLAVALSSLSPASAWLTRQSLAIPAGASGQWVSVETARGPALLPLLEANAVDFGGCEGGGGSGGTGGIDFDDDPSGPGSGSPAGPSGGPGSGTFVSSAGSDVYVDSGCSCSGNVGSDGGGWEDDSDTTDGDDGDDGDGDTVDVDTGSSSSDDCEGDTAEEAADTDDCEGDTSEEASSGTDDCSGETSDAGSSGDDCGDDASGSSGDDCGGDASSTSGGDSCDSGSSSGSSSGCDSGGGTTSSGDCSIASSRAPKQRARGPRLSAMTFAGLVILAPIRRLTRRRPGTTQRPSHEKH